MNAQLRELLTRIPASPETDELQSLLESMSHERRQAKTRALRHLAYCAGYTEAVAEEINNIPE